MIHGNYLDDEEIGLLAAGAARMAAVYCPRSHDWFAHRAYPLQKMLAAGDLVALGTDGRGSSPDLSILAEMRFAARCHPAVGRGQILTMGTLAGARALGREREAGSLEPGKRADLAVVALPDRDAAIRTSCYSSRTSRLLPATAGASNSASPLPVGKRLEESLLAQKALG